MAEKEIFPSDNGEEEEDDDECKTVMVSGVPSDFLLKAVKSYFEKKDRSNGGPIKGNIKRIGNSKRVIITFESAKDAENVVQKKCHQVSKYELRANLYKNLVWQNDAMIVSNGDSNLSEKMLIDFLEKKTKLDVVYVSPGRKAGSFLVYCQNEIDFEFVQKKCQNNDLNGKTLEVDNIEEIHNILVKRVSSKVSIDMIRNYFRNKKISSGGDVTAIRREMDDSYVVSFKEKSVVLDVCSREHQLKDVLLDIQPYWEPFEENTISKKQSHVYSLPSIFYLTFLKKHKIIVNDQLKKWADVIWKDSKFNKLKFNYTEGTFEKIDTVLKDLLNSITFEIVDIPAMIFKSFVGKFNSEADQRYIYFDNRNHQANILGFNKSTVIKIKQRLLDNLIIKYEDNLDIHEKRILTDLNFFRNIEREFRGLKFKDFGNKVIYEGHSFQIDGCQKNKFKILKSIVKSKLSLPLNTGMIMNKKPVKEYLEKRLKHKNCVGSWETGNNDSVLIYASDKTHLSLMEEIMKESFVATTLDFIEKIKATSNYEKWLNLLKNLKEDFPDLYFIGEDNLCFVAVDAVFNDIKSKIDNFVQSLTFESCILMTRAHFLFLKQFNEEDINDFSKKNKIKKVCLKENKLYLEGTQTQINIMETFIEYLKKDINSQEELFDIFGFEEFVKSEEGSNFLSKMEKKCESIISLNSDLGSETDEVVKVLYKNCEIVLREGDITSQDTDAIVNAANGDLKHMGGIAAAIVQKGGYEIQAESFNIMKRRGSALKTGEVVATKAGKLKCKTIIHAVGPVWNNGYSHESFHLSKAVQNCLAFLDNHSYTSIAIPAISTGIFGIPIDEGTRCTIMSIKTYLDTNISSKIKHVCLIDVRKEVIRSFKLHLERVFKISKTESKPSNTSLPDRPQKTFSKTSKENIRENIKINLLIDSISNASVDVIVNSTTENLTLESGSISKFILKAAGPQIQDECRQKYPQGISTTTIAVTKGYNLNCKNVFHLVLPCFDRNSSDVILQNLIQIITICLKTADKMGAKSLAFPILGAGNLNYPIEELPATMYEAVKNYSLKKSSKIKVVNFVIFPKDTEIIKVFDEYQLNRQDNKGFLSKESKPSNTSLPDRPQKRKTSKENTGIEINLMIDSISNASVDVIVNSTTGNLSLGSGSISRFILQAAGPQIQAECSQNYPQGISTSTIAVTKGYNLNCKNVFHLNLPCFNRGSSHVILQNLTQIITICLQTADSMGAKSLAFPILGAGNLKYPIEELPATMYEAVKNYSLLNSSQIKVVNFVVFPKDTEIIKRFEEYFEEMPTDGADTSSDDEYFETKENVSLGQQNNGVLLKFFAKYKNLAQAIKTVKEEYQYLLTTEKLPFDSDLTKDRKKCIMNIGRNYKIQLSISDTINIFGRESDVKDAKFSIQTLLFEFKDNDEETLIKKMVQWYYVDKKVPDILMKFSDKLNVKLEKAFSQKKTTLTWKTNKYNIEGMNFEKDGKYFKILRKSNQKDEAIPDTWSPMGEKELMKIVEVTRGKEYDDIQSTFRQNFPSYRIIKIERIQNKTLYHGYQVFKKKFELENPSIRNEVDNLWHGTGVESVKGINKSGFNRSYCGKNATAFGEGVYFARDIRYSASDTYSSPDNHGTKRIYKCSVLVGQVMQGYSGLKVLKDSYNTAVDNTQNPSIYVTFHDSQAYPNYLITFSK